MADDQQPPPAASVQWLSRRGNRFGCRICHAARSEFINGFRDAFASYNVKKLKTSNVKRHMKSKMHQRNVAAMNLGSNPNAPTPELFDQVWTTRSLGASFAAPIDGVTLGGRSGSHAVNQGEVHGLVHRRSPTSAFPNVPKVRCQRDVDSRRQA